MGDIRNQGLGNYLISTLGTLSWVSGKLGATAMRGGDGTQVINGLSINNNFTTLLNGDYSISVWIKPYGTHVHYNGSIMSSGNWNTANKRWAFGVNQDNTKVDVLGFNYNTYIDCPVPVNDWTHLICTCGSDRKIKLYKNGIYIGERDGSSDPAIDSDASVTCIGRESYANGYFSFNGAIQDLRLYNHCLSELEVKELSKGLVLHYPLNREGWGQENLLPISGSTIINSTQSFEFQGWVQNFYTKTWMNEHLTPGKQYTLSYTVTCLSIPDSNYTFKENRASPILVHQGSGWSQITTTSDGIKNTNMSVGQSRDYKCTFVFATASESYEYYGLCGYTALYRDASNNTQYARFRIDNLKLEEGSIATPWCPNSSDTLATTMGLNSIIEYNTSGYYNNLNKNGTYSYTSDTPKYAVSTVFNGTEVLSTTSPGADILTISCWAKTSKNKSTS